MNDAPRHLLGLRGMTAEEIRGLLARASAFLDGAEAGEALAGRTVAMLFAENSTRTRGSFTVAAHRLGAGVLDFSAGSSLSKGETFTDTARTLEAMGTDAIVVRSAQSGAPHLVARSVLCSVVNAGDGRHQHPTQGLLDALAFARATGRVGDRVGGFDFTGTTLAVVGDIASSRVARSDAAAFGALGRVRGLDQVNIEVDCSDMGRAALEHGLHQPDRLAGLALGRPSVGLPIIPRLGVHNRFGGERQDMVVAGMCCGDLLHGP